MPPQLPTPELREANIEFWVTPRDRPVQNAPDVPGVWSTPRDASPSATWPELVAGGERLSQLSDSSVEWLAA